MNDKKLFHSNGGGGGKKKGEPGYEGRALTEEDELLALRRYMDFVVKTKDLEPFTYDAMDVIKTLPTDGGEILPCGENRFQHLVNEKCSKPDRRGDWPICERVMKTGETCGRRLGHNLSCQGRKSMDRNRRNVAAREAKLNASKANAVDKRKRKA